MHKIKTILSIIFFCLTIQNVTAVYHRVGGFRNQYLNDNIAILEDSILLMDEIGIKVIDAGNPLDPQLMSELKIGRIIDYQIEDNLAFLASVDDQIIIADVSDLYNIEIISNISNIDVRTILIEDNYLYCTAWDDGVKIFDISDPLNVILTGNISTMKAADIAKFNNTIYITKYLGNIQAIDVSDPANPTIIYEMPDSPEWYSDLKVIDSLLYVGTSNEGLQIYEIQDDFSLNLVNVFDAQFSSMNRSGDDLYLSCSIGGFQHVDISDPENPNQIGFFSTHYAPVASVVKDNKAYVCDQYFGLEIYDISDPGNEYLVGMLAMENYFGYEESHFTAKNFSLIDNFLYVTGGSPYLNIVNLDDPYEPNIANLFGMTYNNVSNIQFNGNYAYISCGDHLAILNVMNPEYPQFFESFDNVDKFIGLYGTYNVVAIVMSEGKLKFIDVNDPQNLHVISAIDMPYEIIDYVTKDQNIYFITRNNGLQIVKFSAVSEPELISPVNSFTNLRSINRKLQTLYVPANFDGIHLFDVNNSDEPEYIKTLTNRPDSRFVTKPLIHENHMYIEDRTWNEILIYDISDTEDPVLVETFKWNLSTIDFAVHNDYIITLNDYFGVSVFDFNSLTDVEDNVVENNIYGLTNYPNPFNPTTSIQFNLAENSSIDLSIYNVKGQKVKTLSNENLSKGTHKVQWNGDDDSGKGVSSGIYYYRLNSGGQTLATEKCLLLK
jgi:hypothetical protein